MSQGLSYAFGEPFPAILVTAMERYGTEVNRMRNWTAQQRRAKRGKKGEDDATD